MINKKTGDIKIENLTLAPDYRIECFLSTVFAKNSRRTTPVEGVEVFSSIVVEPFLVTLQFKNGVLREVGLALSDPETASWETWTEKAELELKQKHDLWLENELGKGSYDYEWGSVYSAYDPKGGASSITIRYK